MNRSDVDITTNAINMTQSIASTFASAMTSATSAMTTAMTSMNHDAHETCRVALRTRRSKNVKEDEEEYNEEDEEEHNEEDEEEHDEEQEKEDDALICDFRNSIQNFSQARAVFKKQSDVLYTARRKRVRVG